MECDTSMDNVSNDNWIVGRQASQPNDCMLTIVGFSEKNIGKYSCIGFLPLGTSLFEKDKSGVSIDLEMEKSDSILYYVLPAAIALLLIIVIVLLFVALQRKRRRKLKKGEVLFFIACVCVGSTRLIAILYAHVDLHSKTSSQKKNYGATGCLTPSMLTKLILTSQN